MKSKSTQTTVEKSIESELRALRKQAKNIQKEFQAAQEAFPNLTRAFGIVARYAVFLRTQQELLPRGPNDPPSLADVVKTLCAMLGQHFCACVNGGDCRAFTSLDKGSVSIQQPASCAELRKKYEEALQAAREAMRLGQFRRAAEINHGDSEDSAAYWYRQMLLRGCLFEIVSLA